MCSHTVWSTLRTVWHDALRAGFFKIAPDPSRLVTPPVIEESTENFREALTNIACQATSLQENFNRSNVQPIEQPMLEIGLHSDNLQLFNVGFCLDYYGVKLSLFIALFDFTVFCRYCILGDPGAASRDDGIFMGESLQRERESPWALTLTDPVPEAFEFSPSDWPEKYFSGQSAKRNSRATLVSSYTRLFSSSIAVVAWPVQREHF